MNFANFDLAAWIVYLENRHKQPIQLGLTRVSYAANKLNLIPNPKIKVITIAGTNGKGSTLAALEAIYTDAGYMVASYSSPHVLKINERIRINKTMITDEAFCEALTYVEKNKGDVSLTYFEHLTLAAFYYFKLFNLDLILLEVGMGGRLDATNIVNADLSIITTIDYDHQAFLGDTLEAIAKEKAGIMRQDKICIYADEQVPQPILEQAKILNTILIRYKLDYDCIVDNDKFQFRYKNEIFNLPKPKLNIKAVAAAIMATILFQDFFSLKPNHYNGINTSFALGRLQLIKKDKLILFDVAHNLQAAKNLVNYIIQLNQKKIHIIFSALEDKEIEKMLGCFLLSEKKIYKWYPTLLNDRRAIKLKNLQLAFEKNNLDVTIITKPIAAFERAYKQAQKNELIVVFGSFLLVGEILTYVYNTF